MPRLLWMSFAVLLLASIAFASSGGSTRTEARWVITDLGTLGGPGSEAVAINNRGQIVGWSDTKMRVKGALEDIHVVHAFLWQDGKMKDIGVPGFDWSSGTDINDHGEIVGNMGDGPLGGRSFLLRNGKIRDLLGKDGAAQAINGQGDVVGSVGAPWDDAQCFIWRGGKARIFGTRNPWCRAKDLNEQGQVVGWKGVRPHGFRPFRWQQGRMRDLGVLRVSGLAAAEGINESGAVVGSAYAFVNPSVRDDVHPARAFLWRNGKMTGLGLPPGYLLGMAAGINDSGQIVGSAPRKDGTVRAFLWAGGRAHDLGALSGGKSEANAINNRGQVVGWSWRAGERHAVLWTLKRG